MGSCPQLPFKQDDSLFFPLFGNLSNLLSRCNGYAEIFHLQLPKPPCYTTQPTHEQENNLTCRQWMFYFIARSTLTFPTAHKLRCPHRVHPTRFSIWQRLGATLFKPCVWCVWWGQDGDWVQDAKLSTCIVTISNSRRASTINLSSIWTYVRSIVQPQRSP